MTTEWTDLPDLQAVAIAQSKDWEIEVDWNDAGEWRNWGKADWHDDAKYRARPRQPKMKNVKMLCQLSSEGELRWLEIDQSPFGWIRIPAQDIEIEIPEGV